VSCFTVGDNARKHEKEEEEEEEEQEEQDSKIDEY